MLVNRLWTRVGVRTASVGVLVAGLIGGVYLGQDHLSATPGDTIANAAQADLDIQLLKQHESRHAAARAWQRQAEGQAATKAAAAAGATAGRAHKLEGKVAEDKKAAEQRKKEEKEAETGGPVAYTGPIPSSCNEYSGSRKIGCALMLDEGFPIAEFPCLDKLWKAESGWNYRAENKGSGAYGIPQALPGKKMSSEGADWKTNPATQIKWGLGYVKGRYDSPCGAWGYFQSNGHY
jgi:hypothetical protein